MSRAEELKAQTVEELKELCKEMGLRNYSDLKEDELIEKIIKAEDEAAKKAEAAKTSKTYKKLVKNPLSLGVITTPFGLADITVTKTELSQGKTAKKIAAAIKHKMIEEIK